MGHTFKHLGHKIIKDPKVVDESKIVDVPTPPGFVEKRMTLRAIKNYGGSKVTKAKGGAIKKKKKFPDLSGDGKITKKDILMARGVIKKPKKRSKK